MDDLQVKRQKVLEKIKKCLALSDSTNPHEAEAALRQAKKLMEKFRLEEADVLASRAEEHVLILGKAKAAPAVWIRMLGNVVAESMNCICFYRHGKSGQALIFIGEIGNGELAAYAFTVLSRQLKAMKKGYLESNSHLSHASQRKIGTMYTEGWIRTVGSRVAQFAAMNEQAEQAIEAYKNAHYPDPNQVKQRRRTVDSQQFKARMQGADDGLRVALHRPIGAAEVLRIEAD